MENESALTETLNLAGEGALATTAATETAGSVSSPDQPHRKRLQRMEFTRGGIALVATGIVASVTIWNATRGLRNGASPAELHKTVTELGPLLTRGNNFDPANAVVVPNSKAEMKIRTFFQKKEAAGKVRVSDILCIPVFNGEVSPDPSRSNLMYVKATIQFKGVFRDPQGRLSDMDGRSIRDSQTAICTRSATLFFEGSRIADFENLL